MHGFSLIYPRTAISRSCFDTAFGLLSTNGQHAIAIQVKITMMDIDLAKDVFQVYSLDERNHAAVRWVAAN